jgi:sugar lactone lactonase YvrE
MISKYKVRLLIENHRALLGECPVWDDRTQTLFWVDIERGEIHQCSADGTNMRTTHVGERIGCIALRRAEPGFIVGLQHRAALLNLNPIQINTLAAIEPNVPGNRANDGRCDPYGRFWLGTCDMAGTQAKGWLYRIEATCTRVQALGPFICVNGPAFSPDGKFMYCADTYGRVVHQCLISAEGEVLTRAVFLTFDHPASGYPDGLTCDAMGCLWVAHWGGSRISRFSPAGTALDVVQLPVAQVTSCTFGGPELRTLFITSASQGLRLENNANALAGAVFAVDVDVQGLSAARFAG